VQFEASRRGAKVELAISTEGPCAVDKVYVILNADEREVNAPFVVSLPADSFDLAWVMGARAVDHCGHLVGNSVTEHESP
jgi:hypothetical protein